VSVRLLGLDFADLDASAAAALVAQQPAGAPFRYVVTPNADHLVRLARHPEMEAAYAGAWLRLLDSRVVARAARLLGLSVPLVAPGSDLTALLLAECLKPRERVTIVGMRPARLTELVRRYRLEAVAHYDPPMGFENDSGTFHAAIAFVVAHPARFIFLAVGSPRQEMLAAAIAATGQASGVGLCVGASVVSRAKIHNQSCRANGGIFRAALPRLTLRMISLADFVQTKGFGLALLCSI
jgi:N-acetylglucosaminyldiphosphoundecaprenol N-acetyl-beta-D-mannosaminyltransferase